MLRLLPPLCWTGLIAYFGSAEWGGAQTAAWLAPLLLALLPGLSPELVQSAHVLIRKAGHVVEYAVLAVLWRRAVGGAWEPMALALLTASLDELRQSVTPGRTGSVYDVLLDGAAAAAPLSFLTARSHRRAASS